MSLQFSRTVRSLNADSYRVARIGTIIMIIVILSLLIWFFFAKVTLQVHSNTIRMTENGRIQGVFPAQSIDQIRPGLSAILRIQDQPGGKTIAIRMIVFAIGKENNLVEAVIVDNKSPTDLAPGDLKGEFLVETGYVTPLELVLRATGYEGAE